MTKALYTKHGPGWVPSDESAERYFHRFKEGDSVLLDFSCPRSIKQHRLYWKMCDIVMQNTDGFFRSTEEVSDSIKLACGLSHTTHIKFKGEVFERKTPTSISFGSMDQTAFSEFFNKSITYITQELVPGLDPLTLQREIEQ